jgi:hypothetical protein
MTSSQEEAFRLEFAVALHDLCQPVTALQFSLEIGRLAGDPEASRQAFEECLVETRRICDAIGVMRCVLDRANARQTNAQKKDFFNQCIENS